MKIIFDERIVHLAKLNLVNFFPKCLPNNIHSP